MKSVRHVYVGLSVCAVHDSTETKKEARPNKTKILDSTKIDDSTTDTKTCLRKETYTQCICVCVTIISVIAVVVENSPSVGSRVSCQNRLLFRPVEHGRACEVRNA